MHGWRLLELHERVQASLPTPLEAAKPLPPQHHLQQLLASQPTASELVQLFHACLGQRDAIRIRSLWESSGSRLLGAPLPQSQAVCLVVALAFAHLDSPAVHVFLAHIHAFPGSLFAALPRFYNLLILNCPLSNDRSLLFEAARKQKVVLSPRAYLAVAACCPDNEEEVLNEMTLHSVMPPPSSLPEFVDLCARNKRMMMAFDLMGTDNNFNHRISPTSVLQGLFAEDNPQIAEAYFEKVVELGIASFPEYETMVAGFCLLGDIHHVGVYYEALVVHGWTASREILIKILKLCAELADVVRAQAIMRELRSLGFIEVDACTLMVSTCARSIENAKQVGNESEVVRLLDVVREWWEYHSNFCKGKPDIQLLHSLFTAYLNAGQYDNAVKIYQPLLDDYIKKVEKIEDSDDTVENLSNLDAPFFNKYISELLNQGRTNETDEHFSLMLRLGIIPDEYTLTAFMKYHLIKKNVPGVFSTFASMVPAHNIKTTPVAYSLLFQACGNDTAITSPPSQYNHVDAPAYVIQHMREHTVTPDVKLWTSLMNACARVGAFVRLWRVWTGLCEMERTEREQWHVLAKRVIDVEIVERAVATRAKRRIVWTPDIMCVMVVVKACFRAADPKFPGERGTVETGQWLTRGLEVWNEMADRGFVFDLRIWMFVTRKVRRMDLDLLVEKIFVATARIYLKKTIEETEALQLRRQRSSDGLFSSLSNRTMDVVVREIPLKPLKTLVETLVESKRPDLLISLLLGFEDVIYEQSRWNFQIVTNGLIDLIKNGLLDVRK
ncbi:hypothetical protein HK096_005009, partial [Nowakowskiella sp. JEL0078]